MNSGAFKTLERTLQFIERDTWKGYETLGLFYSEGNPNNNLYQFRARIDDQLIVRYWLNGNRGWRYKILDRYFLFTNAAFLTLS